MDNEPCAEHKRRRRLWFVAALLASGGLSALIAVSTGVLNLNSSRPSGASVEQMSQQRCEAEVLKRVLIPDKATISDVHTQSTTLDINGQDFTSVTLSEPLKGVDPSRITVLNVSGVANAPSEVGSVIHDRFSCRVYIADGAVAHTLVVFDHDH